MTVNLGAGGARSSAQGPIRKDNRDPQTLATCVAAAAIAGGAAARHHHGGLSATEAHLGIPTGRLSGRRCRWTPALDIPRPTSSPASSTAWRTGNPVRQQGLPGRRGYRRIGPVPADALMKNAWPGQIPAELLGGRYHSDRPGRCHVHRQTAAGPGIPTTQNVVLSSTRRLEAVPRLGQYGAVDLQRRPGRVPA